MKKAIAAVALALVAVFCLAGCGSFDTKSSTVTLRYGGGPFEDAKYKDCIVGAHHDNMTNAEDSYFSYPTSDSDYDATGQKGSDAQPFQSVSKDDVVMNIPVVITFDLKTDCKTLNKFHQALGYRYGAYLDKDGNYSSGWKTVIRKKMGDPVDTTLDRIVQQFNWRQVWNDPKVKAKIENEVTKAMPALVKRASNNASYFDNFTVLIKKPNPDNPALADAVAQTQTKVSQAEAETAQAHADKAKADAQTAVKKAEAANKRAEIEGFRLKGMTANQAINAYLKAQMIESGQNPLQPSYIVGGTNQTP